MKKFYTTKEVMERDSISYLTVFNRVHSGKYGEEGTGWKQLGGDKNSPIVIAEDMLYSIRYSK